MIPETPQHPLLWASESLRADENLVRSAVRTCSRALRFCAPCLQEDKLYVLSLAPWITVDSLPDQLQNDAMFVWGLRTLRSYPNLLLILPLALFAVMDSREDGPLYSIYLYGYPVLLLIYMSG